MNKPPNFERWTPIRPFHIERPCGTQSCPGQMVSTGQAMTMGRTDYQHQCDRCHRVAWFDSQYPRIEQR